MFPSQADQTDFGRKLLAENPNHNGSLGIAISEAVEDCLKNDDTRYTLGSVLNHVAMHQTIIVLEAQKAIRNNRYQTRRNHRLCWWRLQLRRHFHSPSWQTNSRAKQT